MAEAGTSAKADSLAEVDATQEMFKQAVAIKKQDRDKALELLANVVEALVLRYGVAAPECSHAYFQYGMLLFDNSIAQENALQGVPAAQPEQPTHPDSTRENMDPNAPLGQRPPQRGPSTGGAQRPLVPLGAELQEDEEEEEAEGAGEEEDEDDEDEDNRDDDAAKEGSEAEAQEGDNNDGDGDDEEPAEVGDDMALAWEMLEMARMVYAQSPEEHRVNLSEIHLVLGDILAEQEKFEDASREYQQSLDYLSALPAPNHRRLAETHYQHAITQSYLDDIPEAKRSCDLALKHLLARQAELENLLDELAAQPDGAAQIPENAAELKELEKVLRDVRDKVEELDSLIQTRASFKNPLKAAFEAAMEILPKPSTAGASASAAAPEAGTSSKQVHDLGVAGRTKRRITTVPVAVPKQPAPGFGPEAADKGPAPSVAPKKRTLEDIMSSGGAGETVIGFGSGATAGDASEKAKKARAELC